MSRAFQDRAWCQTLQTEADNPLNRLCTLIVETILALLALARFQTWAHRLWDFGSGEEAWPAAAKLARFTL